MKTPKGEITIQTFAMPKDTNPNGDIFGGWLVSQMDLAASVLAKRTCHGRTATVAINSMVFHRPVLVGDIVSCYASLAKIGSTSMTIDVEVWTTSISLPEQKQVTEGSFIFVAIDDDGTPRKVKQSDEA